MPDAGDRPTPFDFSLAPIAEERLTPLRQALAAEGVDPWDRDAFLMARPAIELLRELRPEEGLGEAIDEFVAFVHAAYLYWREGSRTIRLDAESLSRLMGSEQPPGAGQERLACYVQLPARRVWGAAVAGEPPEPLDGCFVVQRGSTLAAVGVFGLHPGRDGFSVVAVEGTRPSGLEREDGTPLFASTLPAGAAAGLYSLTGMEELLELGWRSAASVPSEERA